MGLLRPRRFHCRHCNCGHRGKGEEVVGGFWILSPVVVVFAVGTV